MIRVGLTGGLACGKSFVGSILAELGCHVVRADELGHRVLAPDSEIFSAIVEQFGTGILAADGTIDRKRLASQVFDNPERLAILNGLIHPAVFRLEDEFVAEAERIDPDGIAVVEAAILIETGSYRRFDRLILVVCTEREQIQRSMHRDGCTREEVEARLRRQMPLAEKRKYADFIVDTSGPKARTVDQTRSVYESLRRIKK